MGTDERVALISGLKEATLGKEITKSQVLGNIDNLINNLKINNIRIDGYIFMCIDGKNDYCGYTVLGLYSEDIYIEKILYINEQNSNENNYDKK